MCYLLVVSVVKKVFKINKVLHEADTKLSRVPVAKIPLVIFRGLSLLCLETFDLFLNVSNPPGLLINRLKKFCIRFRFCRDIKVEFKVLNFTMQCG